MFGKTNYKKLAQEAEERALIHFRKLQKIENILNNSDATKENYYITLEKIKLVVHANTTTSSVQIKII